MIFVMFYYVLCISECILAGNFIINHVFPKNLLFKNNTLFTSFLINFAACNFFS
jgi:hypothetical protein